MMNHVLLSAESNNKTTFYGQNRSDLIFDANGLFLKFSILYSSVDRRI